MRKTIPLLFLLNLLFCNAQNTIDSLKLKIASTFDYKKKANLFIDIAWEYMLIENDSAMYYADLGYEFSKGNNYPFGMIINLEMKGLHLESVLNNYDAAAKTYIEAIEIADLLNQTLSDF